MKLAPAVVAALLIAGCSAGASTQATVATPTTPTPATTVPRPASPSVSHDGHVHTARDATLLALQALSRVNLPSGAATETATPSTALSQPAVTTDGDTLVDLPRWWTLPGSVKDVISYVNAHPPTGFVSSGSSGGSDGVTTAMFEGGSLGDPQDGLLVSALQVGNHVDVRADAQVTWLPPRTAQETISSSVTSATLSYAGPVQQPGGPVRTHRQVTVSGSQLRALADEINALETRAPGPPRSCAEDDGEQAVLSVDDAGHHLVFTIRFRGCGGVDVTSDGQAQPGLVGSQRLLDLVHGLVAVVPAPSHAPDVSAAPLDPLPPAFRDPIYSAKAAAIRANALLGYLALPPSSRPRPRPAGMLAPPANDPTRNLIVRSRWWTIPGSARTLLRVLRNQLDTRLFLGTPKTLPGGVTSVSYDLRDGGYVGVAPPSLSTVTLTFRPVGDHLLARVDGAAIWLAHRSADEWIPFSTPVVELTVGPTVPGTPGLPQRHLHYRGNAMTKLTGWLDFSLPAPPGQQSCVTDAHGLTTKLTFRIGHRTVVFRWWDGSCDIVAVTVNGKPATSLESAPRQLVYYLAGIKVP